MRSADLNRLTEVIFMERYDMPASFSWMIDMQERRKEQHMKCKVNCEANK